MSQADKFYEMYIDYKTRIDRKIRDFLSGEIGNSNLSKYRESIYEPVNYIMSGNGKRIRPFLVLLSCEAFGGNPETALDAAAAVEILHNFTLVHDDIMDNAASRRGNETVHTKWNTNTAILAGDELIALSYKSLLKTKSQRVPEITGTFTEGLIQICEGQAMDKEFESADGVTLDEYMLMIKKKTAAMLKLAGVIGAIIADADKEEVTAIGCYSENLGIAFQIQDDLLDVYSNEKELGKKIGGDIVENKKTYLYLKALSIANDGNEQAFEKLYSGSNKSKISEVLEFYNKSGIIDEARTDVMEYTEKANCFLKNVKNEKCRDFFKSFSGMLLNRSS